MILQEDIEFLEHFGVKGMQWGTRKAERGGVSRKTDRDAAKDAKESARAKMFYGQGAGNRRKLIKNTVEAKSKRDPGYKKSFDRHLAKQDMATHASKAQSQRKRVDRTDRTKKQAGFLARHVTGEMGTQAAFAAVALGGAAYMASPRGKAMRDQVVNKINDKQKSRKVVTDLSDYLKRQG